VIFATHTPVNDYVVMHTKQAPYRSYAVAARIPADALAPSLCWDLEQPYHYVRTSRAEDGSTLLIVGGEDHKVGQDDHPEQHWVQLEHWLREHFPMAGRPELRWSGQVLEPNDGAGFIGRNPGNQNVYVATGFSGNGMTYSAIAALVISDLIGDLDNPWWEAYDPERKPLAPRAALDFARENLNVAARYADWLSPGDVSSVDRIPRGQGAVIRRGTHKLAVYVDAQGRAHERSAKCPHLGCVVAWNGAEKSWDCPCHGSRFDRYGHLLVGPALEDLEPAPERAQAPGAQAQR
jgi:nitrite reductase/ring-hydroxylating ferredoxin subunit